MKIEFSKMTGAGNDFVVLGPAYSSLRTAAPELARRLCPRRVSVGADGLILVDTSDGLAMHYFNSDGSKAPFCGNGARCFVLFCKLKGIAEGKIEFSTGSGHHSGEVLDGTVRVSVAPARLEKVLSLDAGGRSWEVHMVRAGVPHAVILLDRADTVDVESVGRVIRSDPVFGAEGTNVDFVGPDTAGDFSIRTYERGVEKETLACGSGCVAAACVLVEKGLAGEEVTLKVASGERLTVKHTGRKGVDTYLAGPAVMVFEGNLDVDL